ncbi:ATP-dependent DNA helicase [Auraticoccus sp. F435]|uniref:ATP-dependent helicase DinG n=1 Tax=Auraticoccus cholistanensis TaxID=2656650 RepID=A0A6A9URY6_9ACTN|nr:ATP-dependent DNA helicase [Auraticoccus cholistanensis]MVA75676.1 ATP-dependent DNA helicase [Auraticoccus cholistanensis]
MADAVAATLSTGQHLLVQAGTGTGKSLGYLAPVLSHLAAHPDDRVVVATATLALQAQLASKDIPAALDAVERVTGRRPRHAVLKGRSNYACLLRVRDQVIDDQDALVTGADLLAQAEGARPTTADPTPGGPGAGPGSSALGAQVLALREWAEEQAGGGGLADRDDAPSHGPKAWAQVSVPVRECLGAARCPWGEVCFVEKSREKAREADLVVTNHALLAIDAMHGGTALPEHTAVVIDEAHELVGRVTGAASGELSPAHLERVARRCLTWLDDDLGGEFLDTADVLREALEEAAPERLTDPDHPVVQALRTVRDVARRVVSAMGRGEGGQSGEVDPEQRQAGSVAKEVFDLAERMAALAEADVVWVLDRERAGRELRVAPLSVAGLMRSHVLSQHPTVLTSATLQVGGDFTATAASIGLQTRERTDDPTRAPTEEVLSWRGIDVGSPFEYRRQGILYVAERLPPPRRDGITPETLTEVAELVWAAGGRTLGLFASQRAAEAAAAHVRRELKDHTVLCQGEAQLSELTRRFAEEPETSLFGTVSLWQGIDVPGDTCELVIIDKLPFPRPDEPLMQARQQAVTEAGGNGFMQVAATHAALLLAQGAGRLIRRATDRGVVAVLDPRLVTARYGAFLRSTMPPMWTTTDREVAVQALRRLQETRQAS